MKINFNEIPTEVLPQFLGGEKELTRQLFCDELNKVMKARLIPGASIGMHCHTTSSEIILITQGGGHVLYEGQQIPLTAGDVHYCPKGHAHSLVNDSADVLDFVAVVPAQ